MEFCIMNDNCPFWRNCREPGLCRHEIFFGTGNRRLSIEDGLVVFLTPEMQNMTNYGVHFNRDFDLKLKKAGERAWIDYYGKSKEDFIKRYGRNYL